MFMVPCIVNVFKKHQPEATLHNGIYYYTCSTCFRSSKLCTQHRVFVELLLLLTAMESELELQLTRDSGKKQKKLDKYPMLSIQF